jgi:hypothetical protein
MAIDSVGMYCNTIKRDSSYSLKITNLSNGSIAIQYGEKSRDIFIVKKDDFLNALKILGLTGK